MKYEQCYINTYKHIFRAISKHTYSKEDTVTDLKVFLTYLFTSFESNETNTQTKQTAKLRTEGSPSFSDDGHATWSAKSNVLAGFSLKEEIKSPAH